jgi:hypothetical protein
MRAHLVLYLCDRQLPAPTDHAALAVLMRKIVHLRESVCLLSGTNLCTVYER